MELTPDDRRALAQAAALLENPGFAARLADMVGQPFDRLMGMLPQQVSGPVNQAVTTAIRKALDVAVNSMGRDRKPPGDTYLKGLTGVTGAVGGFFGLPALAIELPLTTTVMLRSIAEIARREGEDLDDPEARLACLEVFALGGRSGRDPAAETGYYAVRAVLARAVSEAASYIAERGLAEEGAPALVRFIASIAARFGVVVSEKAAAGAVPVLGALGGAGINLLFTDHFQKTAQGHFAIRRLERRYGPELVRSEYDDVAARLRGAV
jgi:hypothetical protein